MTGVGLFLVILGAVLSLGAVASQWRYQEGLTAHSHQVWRWMKKIGIVVACVGVVITLVSVAG